MNAPQLSSTRNRASISLVRVGAALVDDSRFPVLLALGAGLVAASLLTSKGRR